MVVTLDVGDPKDIHPRRKVPVGERLARLALATAYGRDLVAGGPRFEAAAREGRRMRVRFAQADGLRTRDGGELARRPPVLRQHRAG